MVLGCLLALSVPLLAYLVGDVVLCLLEAQLDGMPHQRLSPWLPDPDAFFGDSLAPLARVMILLGMILGVLLVSSLLLWAFYRQTQRAAVEFEVRMLDQLSQHARRLATQRTLSAQQTALSDCLDYHLPRVRAMLARWWRTFPRHVVQLVACLVVALILAPMLTALTTVGTVLIVLVYRFVDRGRRLSLPMVRERASQARGSLFQLSLQGPLLDSVHHEQVIADQFATHLASYRRDATASLNTSAWRIPTVVFLSGGLAALFALVLSVQILASDSPRTMASVLPFALCLGGAAVSAYRLDRINRDFKLVETAAEELDRFLGLPIVEQSEENLHELKRITQHVELEHVTLQDTHGRRLLDDVSVVFEPGKLVGVVSSQALQSRALVELLMGFGRPISGRMLLDGQQVTNLTPRSVKQCAHWVASDGALVTGSVLENLGRPGEPLPGERAGQVLAAARLTDCIGRLPDETMTLITPDDDRLQGDDPFRIGLGRASMRGASIVVIEEPVSQVEPSAEQQTLEAIRSLVSPQAITIVLPSRLATLRACDVVIMLHEHRILDTGSHADLLQRNELYRHLNYLRFNPFRGVS